MGIMVCSLLWVMQDFDHQPYYPKAWPTVLPSMKNFEDSACLCPEAHWQGSFPQMPAKPAMGGRNTEKKLGSFKGSFQGLDTNMDGATAGLGYK